MGEIRSILGSQVMAHTM